jgi:hypothetical protein
MVCSRAEARAMLPRKDLNGLLKSIEVTIVHHQKEKA